MNSLRDGRVFMRSLATRRRNAATSAVLERRDRAHARPGLRSRHRRDGRHRPERLGDRRPRRRLALRDDGEYGAASQLEKIDMLDFAEIVVLNKFDKRGSQDALRDVRKQWRRNHLAFTASDDEVPVFPTIASQFNDPGVTLLFAALCRALTRERARAAGRSSCRRSRSPTATLPTRGALIPPERTRLSRRDRGAGPRDRRADRAVGRDRRHGAALLRGAQGRRRSAAARAARAVSAGRARGAATHAPFRAAYNAALAELGADAVDALREPPGADRGDHPETYSYDVRGRAVTGDNYRESLSAPARPQDRRAALLGLGRAARASCSREPAGRTTRTPAACIPYRRAGEDPIRMFAGEGTPERTNRRFHYLSRGPAGRAPVDRVRLGHAVRRGPDPRPDIYGKVGNSGVTIATLDDMKKLYSGFDLCTPTTSVSMTINGPAPMILGDVHEHRDRPAGREVPARGSASWDATERRIDAMFADGVAAALPRRRCPRATTGSGSGCSASPATRSSTPRPTSGSRPRRCTTRARHRAGRHPQGGPGAEHLHLLHRVRAADDGRHPAVLHRQQGAQLLLGVDLAAITSPRPARTRSPSSPSRWPTASRSSSTTSRAA